MSFITYFDEVKADPKQGRVHYFVGGITIPMAIISSIEGQLNDLAQQAFGSIELTPETEFHASFIYRGAGPFKGKKPQERIDLLTALAAILSSHADIKRVYAAIDSSKLYNSKQAPEFAFAHFCERVQMLLGRNQSTILIGDRDDEQMKEMVRAFARYRANGTPWSYGIAITSIVDSVHFAQSHHSRMIQLADAYLFFATHTCGSRKGPMAEALSAALAKVDLFPHRYKHWPTK